MAEEKSPFATVEDLEGLRGVIMAVRNLHTRQALTLEEAWSILIQQEGGPERMPAEHVELTKRALQEFGYVEHWVVPVGGSEGYTLWIRPPWRSETIEEVPLT